MKFEYMVAITGSIGTGKSLVTSMLKEHRFEVIDADKIAHEVLNNSIKEIGETFGEGYINSDKIVDRKKLGTLVFNDKKAKTKLENIIHKKIYDRIISSALNLEEKKKIYFLDIPLLFESKNRYDPKFICVVYTPENTQIKRVMKRDDINEEEAIKRVKSQIDIEIKKQNANFVIDNTKDKDHLIVEVESFLKKLKDKYANCKI